MPFHLTSYATAKYRHRQLFLNASALANRIVSTADSWSPRRLVDAGFMDIAPDISLSERGSGFWAWKPFIILRTLESVAEGDSVLYCDAGRKYPYILLDTPLDPFLTWMDRHNQDIMPGVAIPWNGPMSAWTKHDAFASTGVDNEILRSASPIQASFSIWRNRESTRELVREWLSWCVQRQLVSDDPSIGVESEGAGFKAHRHDQSLLNLCCHKHGITGMDLGPTQPPYNERDPSHVLKHVFGSKSLATPLGNAVALASIPVQFMERILRERISFGKKYD